MKKWSFVEMAVAGVLIVFLVCGIGFAVAESMKPTIIPPPVLIVKNGPGGDTMSGSSSTMRGLGRVGDIESFSVFIPTNSAITNVDLNMCFAKVTNVSGAWRVVTTGAVPGAYFETNAGYFAGSTNNCAVTNGWNNFYFQMSSNYFMSNSNTDKLLLLVPSQTGTNIPYQGGVLFSIDSPWDGWQYP
ncbi:MAG: hypothetical protein WC003_04495 [Terrimicrobiaceae bacterium]